VLEKSPKQNLTVIFCKQLVANNQYLNIGEYSWLDKEAF
jgi:hypothetical protein